MEQQIKNSRKIPLGARDPVQREYMEQQRKLRHDTIRHATLLSYGKELIDSMNVDVPDRDRLVCRSKETYTRPYEIRWYADDAGLVTPVCVFPNGKQIPAVWAPLPGAQTAFLRSTAFEVLLAGNRGPGKTDVLFMDYLAGVGRGWGAEWRGIIFRQTYPQLQDLAVKTKKWIPRIFPNARYNKVEHTWTFEDGEQLLLRYMRSSEDYWNYHGHAYPWIGWEELCTWPDDKCYTVMMSCCRSAHPGMPRSYRSTANPYGVGHNWVKTRFKLPHMFGQIQHNYGKGMERLALEAHLKENPILLYSDPDYVNKVRAAARNPSEEAAWVDGSWDITAGGIFDDLWDGKIHVVPTVPAHLIPKGWRIDRSFDWGSSKPFSVGFWAESNGEPFTHNGHTYGVVKGDVYRIGEWYGWSGTRNEGVRLPVDEIARGIVDRLSDMGIKDRCLPGPADDNIFDDTHGVSMAKTMQNNGVKWTKADKGPGSRKQGWEQMRIMLRNAKPGLEGGRDSPGLFVFSNCEQFIATVPVLPRCHRDLDDVDTDAEDHIADETRYRLRRRTRKAEQREGL